MENGHGGRRRGGRRKDSEGRPEWYVSHSDPAYIAIASHNEIPAYRNYQIFCKGLKDPAKTETTTRIKINDRHEECHSVHVTLAAPSGVEENLHIEDNNVCGVEEGKPGEFENFRTVSSRRIFNEILVFLKPQILTASRLGRQEAGCFCSGKVRPIEFTLAGPEAVVLVFSKAIRPKHNICDY